ncbi:glucans biosynthesis glucosyltransferase MdoH [Sphingomonas sp. MMS24-J13]|uniref:glucans biosynthesis glucosyltransferase MdoH n=1 Tax=Sphingomonas sp. MMS24-J13 TaxID=3238686 RepID=UPI0038505730
MLSLRLTLAKTAKTDPAGTGFWDGPGDLPPEAPLAMPEQDFDRAPAALPLAGSRTVASRRIFMIGGSGLIGLVASCGVARPLALDGFDSVDQCLSLLSFALFSWIAFGFLNACAGFCVMMRQRRSAGAPGFALPAERVAVLMPVYNEDVAAIGGRIARMGASLRRVGAAHLFDFFILSDSNEAAEADERAMCRRLRDVHGPAVYYRRRPVNTARKPGNIAEWVGRFGGGYEAMIILDADSLMTGETMVRLATALEDEPRLGLIQTNPQLIGGRTLFARWQQFAGALYGPTASAGLDWWSGNEATFWGHNAIVRTRAFAQSCGLPRLSGPEPFGGHILSHDMVEAALLRRRGWATRMMILSAGSYEECPPTLVDHGVRDRRWCQGNIQHLRLLDTAGLHWISRLQLLMGASAYMTSPLWLLMLLVGLYQGTMIGAPMADSGTSRWLIALTVLLLFGGKAIALLWAAFDRRLVAVMGGWRAILIGVAVDVPLSIIAAPVIMASQCISIGEILAGRKSGWLPQRRDTDGIMLAEAFDHYRWHMLLGLAFWVASFSEIGGAAWGLPVALGLLGAPFFATVTSRADFGALAQSRGIFVAEPERAEQPIPAGATLPRDAMVAAA